MLRQIVAVGLMLALALALPAQEVPKATPKEKILSIPTGTVVVVKTIGKETLRGRLGEATDAGFAVQVVRQGKVETVQVPFTDLKSVRVTQKAASDGGPWNAVAWAVVGGVGALALLWGIIYSTY